MIILQKSIKKQPVFKKKYVQMKLLFKNATWHILYLKQITIPKVTSWLIYRTKTTRTYCVFKVYNWTLCVQTWRIPALESVFSGHSCCPCLLVMTVSVFCTYWVVSSNHQSVALLHKNLQFNTIKSLFTFEEKKTTILWH